MGTMEKTAADGAATLVDVELVQRSMQWDEEAFRKVYEATYYRMLYIARKYMKSDAAAEDVLQEAYIKIWTNLPQLGNPEAYVSWASRIVANTALNELRKKQPMLFSEMSAEGEDGSEMAFDVEDTYTPNQPELSFTENEEQMIIREMIDSLSDEQRMCVLMYYMEELSVHEIAETLGCSEGTVKSRLNYGRKNIRAKAEELQKKGYNFKGISALAVLLLLLGREAARMWARPVVVTAAAVTPAAGAAASTGVGTAAAGGAQGGVIPTATAGTAATGGVQGGTIPTATAGTAATGGAQGGAIPTAATGGTWGGVIPTATAGNGAAAASTAGSGMSGSAADSVGKVSAKANAAPVSGAAKGSFFRTVAGKLLLAGLGVLVVVGIILTIILLRKDKEDSSSYSAKGGPDSSAESAASGMDSLTEAKSEKAVSTEAKTPAATEAKTEEVTEEQVEYHAYIDAYAKLLEENKDGILFYENAEYFQGNDHSVALVNTLGDEEPELFFVTQFSNNYPPKLKIYTMIDGAAVLLEGEEDFGQVAGGWFSHTVYASKKENCFYNQTGSGDDGNSGRTERAVLEGKTLKREVIDQWSRNSDGEENVQKAMSAEEEADMGDVILQVDGRNMGDDRKLLGKSYQGAMAELEELAKTNKHAPGWFQSGSDWYYYDKAGQMETGWLELEGKWYYLGADGKMVVGWKRIKGKDYYFNKKGIMATGEVTINKQKYTFDQDGVLQEAKTHTEGDKFLRAMAKALDTKDYDGFFAAYGIYIGYGQFEYGKEDVEYAYIDLNQDGTDELVFRGGFTGVIRFEKGKPVVIVSTNGAIRDGYTVLANGHILYSTATAVSMGITEYELTKDGKDVREVLSITYDANGGEKELKEYNETRSPDMQLNFHKLSEF